MNRRDDLIKFAAWWEQVPEEKINRDMVDKFINDNPPYEVDRQRRIYEITSDAENEIFVLTRALLWVEDDEWQYEKIQLLIAIQHTYIRLVELTTI